ncbi:MAG: tripartite tricarboxylate transporter substrate binding protein [Betaproteobacteria bacterium]|nr:tripartite tricarboxylate transporter substrate binding protein [Betaproteobacteria bacterium]
MSNAKRKLIVGAVAALFTAVAAPAWAQAGFPSKPITFIVPFAPGGATDLMTRLIAQKMAASLGQSVVVENRPGANAIVGTNAVAKAAPDGHTLVMCAFGHATNPYLVAKLPYDTLKDIAPVSLAVTGPHMLAVNPGVPAANLKELIAYGKANPGKLNFASGGIGSSQHFSGELFKSMAGIDMTHIAYKGTAPAFADLISGNVSLIFDNLVLPLQNVKSGKLKALAVTGKQRSPLAPDVPTVSETIPGFESGIWHGVLTTGGTPKAVVDRLAAEVNKALAAPDLRENFQKQGLDPVGTTPEQFDQFIRAEMAKWSKIIKDVGIKAE